MWNWVSLHASWFVERFGICSTGHLVWLTLSAVSERVACAGITGLPRRPCVTTRLVSPAHAGFGLPALVVSDRTEIVTLVILILKSYGFVNVSSTRWLTPGMNVPAGTPVTPNPPAMITLQQYDDAGP